MMTTEWLYDAALCCQLQLYLSMDFINVDDDPKQMYIYSRFLTRAETLF